MRIRSRLPLQLIGILLAVVIVAIGAGYSLLTSALELPPGFSFTAVGDIGANKDAASTLKLIGSSGSNFTVVLGDLSYGELTPESAWCDFVRKNAGDSMPFEIIPGNHEEDGANANIDKLAECLPDRVGGIVGSYPVEYYFDYRNLARFIMVSPDITYKGEHFKYKRNDPRYNWVANAIDEARTAGIQWVIVSAHKPCLSVGRKGCEPGPDLMNLLVEKKVDLVLNGHDHNYQRSKQLAHSDACPEIVPEQFNNRCVADNGRDGVYPKGGGAIFLVIGTGGAELYDTLLSDPDSSFFTRWLGPSNNPTTGFVRFAVSRDQIKGEFVSSNGISSATDSFTISAHP